MQEITSPPEYR